MTLITELRAAGPRLTRRVMDEMYRDPFWTERYGDRGRENADTDGDFHIKYLISAIEGDDPSLFVTYGRWLRDLLVARGMCSRHLVENFERLAAAIAEESWPGRELAISILRGGAAGLRHTAGDAGVIDAHRPAWADRVGPQGDTLLSYLADALATQQRMAFDAYVHLLSRRVDVNALLAQIAALDGLPASALDVLEGRR